MRLLLDCVRHSNLDLAHHRAFWEAVEAKLPPGSLANDGELGSIWVAAVAPKDGLDHELTNLQSWLTFLCGPDVERISRGKIKPLTPAEACGFIGCIIVETGRPLLDRLDVIEAALVPVAGLCSTLASAAPPTTRHALQLSLAVLPPPPTAGSSSISPKSTPGSMTRRKGR